MDPPPLSLTLMLNNIKVDRDHQIMLSSLQFHG